MIIMKISFLICLSFTICSPALLIAQQNIQIGEHRISNNTFVVNKLPTKGDKVSTNIFIKNKKMENVIDGHMQDKRIRAAAEGLRYSKTGALHLIFKEVLGETRINELSSEKVWVTMYFNSSGKVTAVEFMIKEYTQLTLREIERLSDAIEKEITFKFVSVNNDEEKRFAPYTHTIHMNKLLQQLSILNQSETRNKLKP